MFRTIVSKTQSIQQRNMKRPKKNLVWLAVLSSSLTNSCGFAPQIRHMSVIPSQHHRPDVSLNRANTIRCFASSGDGIVGKVKNAAKSILPKSWFQSDAERRATLERKQMRDEMKGSLKAMLKDAPFPVRALGSVIAPMMSSALSGLAEGVAEQQQAVSDQLDKARSLIAADQQVIAILGEGVQVGSPFSQASSSSNINGRVSATVELGFPVSGSRNSGTARLSSVNGEIRLLEVQAGGRVIRVNTEMPRFSSPSSGRFSGSRDDGDVIEAEIIEKDWRSN